MIKNQKQLTSAYQRLDELKQSIAESDSKLDQFSLSSLAEDLASEISLYEQVSKGAKSEFELEELDQLPELLVYARIAAGLTQADLANRLDVKEQQVQRDEAGGYEKSALWRLIDVCDALGYRVEGHLRPHDVDVAWLQSSDLSHESEVLDPVDAWSSGLGQGPGIKWLTDVDTGSSDEMSSEVEGEVVMTSA